MKTLQRHYLRDFLILLSIITFGLSVIFSLLELTGKIDDFASGRRAYTLFLYALYNVPRLLLYLLPMSVLICSLFIFSQAARRKEITAIKAAGGRLRRLFTPFVITGLIITLSAFLLGEIVAPGFSRKAEELKNSSAGKDNRIIFNEGGLWLKSRQGYPVKIDLYIIDKKTASGIIIFVTENNFLREKILAEKAIWIGQAWVLQNVTRYDFVSGEIAKLASMDYPDLESPDFFAKEMKSTEEMGVFELYRYLGRLKKAGFRNTKLMVDINSKISFPVINLFMMLLGIALAVRAGFGGGLFSAGLGLLTSLAYWFSYTLSLSMGYAGIIPPLISAWIVPLLFGTFAVALFLNIQE
jgi:lipopolysaccharide export system permease protein